VTPATPKTKRQANAARARRTKAPKAAPDDARDGGNAAQALAEVRAKADLLSRKLSSPEAKAWIQATLAKAQADLDELTSQPVGSTQKK